MSLRAVSRLLSVSLLSVGPCVALANDSAAVYPVTGAPLLTRETKLTASDAAAGDFFGRYVAVSGQTAVVGAPFDGDAGTFSGSVYVFVRSGAAWSQQQKLTASDAAAGDFFGVSVAVSGDTAVVGAFGDDDGGFTSGAAYVFVRSGTIWHQQQKLVASDATEGVGFGFSVALSGNTAVVGVPGGGAAGTRSGSAYVFVQEEGVWRQEQKLTAADAADLDGFGRSVAVSGDTAVIGAPFDDDAGDVSGSAYVFVRSEGTWSQQRKLTASDAVGGNEFGLAVAASGDTVVIGSPSYYAGIAQGTVYVFVRSAGVWSQQQELTANDAGVGDFFGLSVAVSGDTAVIGAPLNDDRGSNSGTAYVFVRNEGLWIQRQELRASDGATDDEFGISVAVSGDTAVVGALHDDAGSNSGAVYVYEPPYVLTALSPAKIWVGLKNSDDVGLRLDLLAEVFIDTTKVGQGELDNVGGGGTGFNGALLNTIPLALTGGPISTPPGTQLSIKVGARRTCFGTGHNSGTARLWYNGQPVDISAGRDAGSRFDATIGGTTSDEFLRSSFALSTTAGSSRSSADAFVNSSGPCPTRPFTSFGTWSSTLP